MSAFAAGDPGPNPGTEIRLIFVRQFHIRGSTTYTKHSFEQVVKSVWDGTIEPVVQTTRTYRLLSASEYCKPLIAVREGDHRDPYDGSGPEPDLFGDNCWANRSREFIEETDHVSSSRTHSAGSARDVASRWSTAAIDTQRWDTWDRRKISNGKRI